MRQTKPIAKERIARRTFVAGLATTALAGCLGESGTVVAGSVDTITIPPAETTIDGDPKAVQLSVSGSWDLQTTLEDATQLRVECLAEYDGEAETMDTDITFDPRDGDSSSWSIEADLLEHSDIDAKSLNAGAGTTTEKELTLIFAFQLLSNEGIHAEESEHVDVPLTVHQAGHSHDIDSSGEGEITIED